MDHFVNPSSRHDDSAVELEPRRGELSDWFNRRLFHPLARRLALALAPTRVTPNQLSIAGGACVVLAGVAYTLWGGIAGVLTGFALHLGWHVLDGADGDLARLIGKAGPLGEIVDGLSDYFSHIALYIMFGFVLALQYGAAIWLLVAAAGISRIFQTSHQEERRRAYEWWVYGRTWVRIAPLQPTNSGERWLAGITAFYIALADRTQDRSGVVEVLHRKCEDGPAGMAAFRAAAQRHLRPLLGLLGMLGSNHRTLVLGATMLIGRPVWFFVYEALLLNLVLGWSIRAHAQASAQIAQELAGKAETPF